MSRSHRDLKVWQLGLDLVDEVFALTERFPATQRHCLATQIQRAAVSVPSNIAEGAARNSRKEFLRYLYIARGSLAEVQTQLLIAKRLGYIAEQDACEELSGRVFALLAGLITKLKS